MLFIKQLIIADVYDTEGYRTILSEFFLCNHVSFEIGELWRTGNIKYLFEEEWNQTNKQKTSLVVKGFAVMHKFNS